MATSLKLRRGTTAQHASFTGSAAEVTVDTDKNTVVVHNGSTAGGFALMKETGTNDTKFRIDSSGNVLVGTTSPLVNASGRGNITLNGSTDAVFAFGVGGVNSGYIYNNSSVLELAAVGNRFIQFSTNGAERARIDSSGNLGLGVTPSAWRSTTKAIEGPAGSLFSFSTTAIGVAQNAFLDSVGWKYKATSTASNYEQAAGQHFWSTAPSGTAGNAITFTQAMTLDASGNFMIGTTTPLSTSSGRGTITLNGSSTVILNMAVGGTRRGYVYADSFDNTLLGSSGAILFEPANTERARIDSSGNLLLGVTTNAGGYKIRAIADSSGNTGFQFDKGSSTTGSCLELDVGANNTTQKALLVYSGGNGADNLYIYSNGNVVNRNNSYGSLSDVKLKENIVDSTPKLEKLCQVKVRSYNMVGSDVKQIGVVAQELEQIFPSMIDESPDTDKEGNDLGTTTKSVKYSVFVPMLIKAIQEQQAIITDLKARIETLESK
jgi:hypothetical protein